MSSIFTNALARTSGRFPVRFRECFFVETLMSTVLKGIAVAACIATLPACQTSPGSPATVKYMAVNGAGLAYVEQGRGTAVVFVHGGAGDYRSWETQRERLSGKYRTISYTPRYFGTEPWGTDWPKFSVQTHADDLAAFIRGLGAGPVHLVARSYGGHIALNVALRSPDLVKSAFVFEPIVPSYVTDAEELKALGADAAVMFPPIMQAVQSGDNPEAVRRLIDAVGEQAGYFNALPQRTQALMLDSARTMPLIVSAPPPPPISCAQLAQIAAPVVIARGELSRPVHRVVADGAGRCLPPGRLLVIPKTKHMWPSEEPEAFSQTLMAFLKDK